MEGADPGTEVFPMAGPSSTPGLRAMLTPTPTDTAAVLQTHLRPLYYKSRNAAYMPQGGQKWLGALNAPPVTKLPRTSWHAADGGDDGLAGHCTRPQLTPRNTQGGLRRLRDHGSLPPSVA